MRRHETSWASTQDKHFHLRVASELPMAAETTEIMIMTIAEQMSFQKFSGNQMEASTNAAPISAATIAAIRALRGKVLTFRVGANSILPYESLLTKSF
jgi:hypothetical protein